jgi:4-hydroxythreonine-4-phosphate dehydrogenase
VTPAADNPARPTLAVSMGDPLGIGPEIIVKALADRALRRRARFHIYGSSAALDAAALAAGITPFWWRVVHNSEAVAVAMHHDVLVLDYPEFDADDSTAPPAPPGPTRRGGLASFRFVEDAIAAALLPADHPRHAHALVTAPISKTSWHLANHRSFPGHTELLAHRFHAKRHAMLFVGPSLRVVLVTIHIPLMSVRDQLTVGRVFDAIDLAHAACRGLGIGHPRLAVCGLNPHAGEGGLLGDEDQRIITPAVELAVRKGVNAAGPFPADTLFSAAAAPPRGHGRFDCVVAMYHDQGLIPVKLLDGLEAVNVTVGLPTIRTSPAHGTAFDIAGRNAADPASMRAAIELAIEMVGRHGSSL